MDDKLKNETFCYFCARKNEPDIDLYTDKRVMKIVQKCTQPGCTTPELSKS